MMVVYTKKTATPMALKNGANVRDFASHIHKEFIKNFRFARISRNGRIIQAGLNYVLKGGDVVDLYLK